VGLDAEVPAGADHDLFEVANISVNVTAVWGQIEDRVSHRLPRSVVGDVPSSSSLEDLEAHLAQAFLREQ
jgi:hypothetical protein